MAVYTDIGFDELASVLADYDVGAPRSFKGIAEGIENSNYLLQADRGTFILTLYEKRVRAEDLPFFLALLEYLAGKGIACPLPVRTRAGTPSTTLKNRPAALLTFLEGLSLNEPHPDDCAAAGVALAALHRAGADFPQWRENRLSVSSWRNLAQSIGTRADSVEDGLSALIESNLAALENSWPRELPAGIIHADLFPDNVLFIDGRVSGLIDFYFACNDFYIYDLAVMINAWCFEADGRFSRARSHELIAAYARERTLSAPEIAALPLLARGAALRFLLTRLQDWLNHDARALVRPKDPREYSHRLRFHAGVRAPSEYGT